MSINPETLQKALRWNEFSCIKNKIKNFVFEGYCFSM